MNTVREYRMPLIIGAGALVAVLLLWTILVAPQNSKLSSLKSQEMQLQTQQAGLQAKLATLQAEGQRLSSSCADLQKITTQIPSVQTPTDVDAEESSFESQFNALAGSSGVVLSQFSGFAPATRIHRCRPCHPSRDQHPCGRAGAAVTAVPTTLSVTGNYGQITAFINGLDNFPRLFVIQHFDLVFGTSGATAASLGPHGLRRPFWRDAPLGRRDRDPGVSRAVQPGDHRIDLLHLDAERAGRMHEGDRGHRFVQEALILARRPSTQGTIR